MAASDETFDEQAFLDEHYPFIDQNAEPPGRSVPDSFGLNLRVWKGRAGWRTRHGQAVICWDHGQLLEIHDASLPDGSRGAIRFMLDHGYRRPSSGARRWIYGTIDIHPDDVVFTDNAAQPLYAPPAPGDDANLERDLASDPAFLAALHDDRFAHAVYVVFHNREFVRATDLRVWSSGDRGAAHLVAGLRGLGESYQDYFLRYDFAGSWPDDRATRESELRRTIASHERALASSPKIEILIGTVFQGKPIETAEQAGQARDELRKFYEDCRKERASQLASLKKQLAELPEQTYSDVMLALRAHLARLGWCSVNEDDERRMGEEAMRSGLILLDDVRRLEALPSGEPGAWWRAPSQAFRFGTFWIAEPAGAELRPDEQTVRFGLRHRIDALAATGRVSEAEYAVLRDRDLAVQARIGGYVRP